MSQERGRPFKQGLDFFALDCLMGDEVDLIEAKHGHTGFSVMVKTWQKIYNEYGYFMYWDERQQLLSSNKFRLNVDQVTAIIDDCLRWGIFNEDVYKKHGILTSRRIQDQFMRATVRRTRVEVIKDYWIIGDLDRNNVVVLSTYCEHDVDNKSINVDNKCESTPKKTHDKSAGRLNDDIKSIYDDMMHYNNSHSKSNSQSKSNSDIETSLSLPLVPDSEESVRVHEDVPVPKKEPKPKKPSVQDERFKEFYDNYPRKQHRGRAEKFWEKINPDDELFKAIMDKVDDLKTTEDWTKENGKYVPMASTWLNAEGWLDEIPQTRGNGQTKVPDRNRIRADHEYDDPTDVRHSPYFQEFMKKQEAERQAAKEVQE